MLAELSFFAEQKHLKIISAFCRRVPLIKLEGSKVRQEEFDQKSSTMKKSLYFLCFESIVFFLLLLMSIKNINFAIYLPSVIKEGFDNKIIIYSVSAL